MSVLEQFRVDGKVALVTGAASGLGVEFAEAMAEAGAKVVCVDVQKEQNEETAQRVRKLGQEALAIQCDVSHEQQVISAFESAVKNFDRVDILFNNAGITEVPKQLHEFSSEEWNAVLGVDLQGVFYCAREALKIMVKQKRGKIINIASIWGLAGSSSVMPIPAYNTAKGAVVNLTRELGLEYATMGINVNAICPGFFLTKLGGGGYDDPGFCTTVSNFTPMGRIAAASELKGAALFLASPASDYMTGQLLVVDGGILAK
ncbi:MAG: glucose 1-dehydrogenase [Desulfomonilaceae bacterium]